jgi:hypothetical protein
MTEIMMNPKLSIHYQKIDRYKRKYRENIFVGKFSRDFTDGNIPSVYTEGITVEKKLKQSKKKKDDVPFLPTELPMEFIHFPIALLIVVLYRQNHRWIEKSSVLFGGFLKKFN